MKMNQPTCVFGIERNGGQRLEKKREGGWNILTFKRLFFILSHLPLSKQVLKECILNHLKIKAWLEVMKPKYTFNRMQLTQICQG